ncbi:hypothetical protein B4123_2576 [Bacillus paralicheniformis]|nr:hypothetical protein B4123_2576 [Bacillus paralicheniformis]
MNDPKTLIAVQHILFNEKPVSARKTGALRSSAGKHLYHAR